MSLSAYLPPDRCRALQARQQLPGRTSGAALFADISGFTSLTKSWHVLWFTAGMDCRPTWRLIWAMLFRAYLSSTAYSLGQPPQPLCWRVNRSLDHANWFCFRPCMTYNSRLMFLETLHDYYLCARCALRPKSLVVNVCESDMQTVKCYEFAIISANS